MRNSIIVLTLVVLLLVVWLWSGNDEFVEFKAIGYPYLPLDTSTTDPSTFIMVTGYRSPPSEHTMPDGTMVYPICSHPDPKVVPLVEGKVLYFPVKFLDDFSLETPPLPPRSQPLNKNHRGELVRYLSDNTRATMNTAIQGTK